MCNLRNQYSKRYDDILTPLANNIQKDLEEYLNDVERIDRISTRAKSVDRFVAKASKIDVDGEAKYNDPLYQIQDQVGARVICFYLEDVDIVSRLILDYYRPIENKTLIPDSENEFGYVGKHLILHIPPELKNSDTVNFFELQIKTLFQHAWSEANHDLSYKPSSGLSKDQKRKIAFTAAQAWGADMIFNELFADLT